MKTEPKEYFFDANNNGYAIVQLNISSADQMKVAFEAAKKLNTPLMLGTSEGEREFLGVNQAVLLAEYYENSIPVILNADHTKSIEKVREAVLAGYNSIHFDGSSLPYEENVRLTKEAVEIAKNHNEKISVEGELGVIGGTGSSKIFDEEIKIDESLFTDPDQAKDFVEKTGVDRLGVAIGNMHGISKKMTPKLNIERLRKIREAVSKDCILVLHGASGIPDKDVKTAIKNGIAKLNVNTELRIAFAEGVKSRLQEGEITPYKFLKEGQERMQRVAEEKILLSMSDNKL